MSRRRMSPTLSIESGHVVCAGCNHSLVREGSGWKHAAVLSEVVAASMPGAPSAMHPTLLLRRFSCPNCGELLDTETAMAEDPFLDDVLEASHGGR